MDIPTSIESIVLEIVPSQAVVIDEDNSQQQQQKQQKQPTITFRDEVDVSTISDVESHTATGSVETVDNINNIVKSSSDEDTNNNIIDNNIDNNFDNNIVESSSSSDEDINHNEINNNLDNNEIDEKVEQQKQEIVALQSELESTKSVLSNTKSELDNTNSELKITKTNLNAAVLETAVNAKKLNDKKDENHLLKVKNDRLVIERTRLGCENRILNDTLGVKKIEISNLKIEVASLKQIAETQNNQIQVLLAKCSEVTDRCIGLSTRCDTLIDASELINNKVNKMERAMWSNKFKRFFGWVTRASFCRQRSSRDLTVDV